MANVETLIVQALNASPALQGLTPDGQEQVEAFLEVPADRPIRFVTVERASGAEVNHVDQSVLAVQFWAESRLAASDGSQELATILEGLPVTVSNLGKCRVESRYNFPDKRQARYQLTVSASTVQ